MERYTAFMDWKILDCLDVTSSVGSITNAMDLNLGKLQEIVRDRGPGVLQSMGLQRVRHD